MTGAVTDRFGYRKAQIMGCVWSIATVFLQVFAHNRIMILMGKLLNGIVSHRYTLQGARLTRH